MNNLFERFRGLFLVFCFSTLFAMNSFAADAFIDRDGRTFTVSIDGTITTRTAPRDIKDSTSVVPFTVHWSLEIEQGPKCFRITPKDERLGEPERIDVLIHEVDASKPYNSWRNYSAVPSTLENTATFLSGNGFCASEYTLTDRLRFPSLPAGEYIVMISFWGKGNWDRQTISMKVAKSSEQKIEQEAAGTTTAVEPVAAGDCTIEYAAKRTMALHQQLEDKVASGEMNQDVFRSFGEDTQDFGTLYSTDVPEVCRRLEAMKNKYKLR